MLKMVKNLVNDEKGQGMTEYGLILGVIAIGAIVTLGLLKDKIIELITNVKNGMTTTF